MDDACRYHLAWSVPMADPTYVIVSRPHHSLALHRRGRSMRCASLFGLLSSFRMLTVRLFLYCLFQPGAAIHSFCMFAPFFALYEKKGMVVQGCFLFLFGPYLAGLITPNLMEQASIWCFFSIAQIAIMLFCIRETLITNWGRDKTHASLLTGKSGQVDAAKDEAPRVTRGSSKKKASSKAE
jgi:hypothetical protein